MEFHLESFMSEVTAALAYQSPQGLEGRREEDEEISEEHPLRGEILSAYDEFIQYPFDESVMMSPPARSLRHDRLQSVGVLESREDNNTLEHHNEPQTCSPNFFDLGM
jgi:hypothetical protein